jgi:nucleotide-binding universal stress UspA family protein
MVQGIRSVLVGLTEEGREEPVAALPYALSLAAAAGAQLTVEAASLRLALTHAFVSDMATGLVAAENRRLRALAEAAAERARVEAAAAGVACVVESLQLPYGEFVGAFLNQARVHDLAVLDAEEHAVDVDRGLIEAALFRSGRPVIVVPPGRIAFSARRAVVAWDGTAGAARAAAEALPFLRAAEAVAVVSVTGEKSLSGTAGGGALAAHLARHGVPAEARTVAVGPEGGVAGALRRQVGEMDADLLVMGAYERSRLRELVLGGVTQDLLRSPPAPLVMSR